MKAKSCIFIVLTIALVFFCSSCSSKPPEAKRGIDIVGTWIGQSADGKQGLELIVSSVDYTYGHESVTASATFFYDKLSDDWRSSTKETIKVSGSDIAFTYKENYGYATVAFSYGRAISEHVIVTFGTDGTAYFVVNSNDHRIPLTRS